MAEPTENVEGILNIDREKLTWAINGYMIERYENTRGLISERDIIEEMSLVVDLTEIVYDTELPPHFCIVDTTSVEDNKVAEKYEAIRNVPELQDVQLVPEWMTMEYPIPETFDEDTLKKAPWINDIHAWMKVLNYANTLSAIQRGEVEKDEIVGAIAAIAEGLYLFTTESDRKAFLRTSDQFRKQQKFPETVLRESGTEGVNSQRHVSLAEMRYILQTMKNVYAK